MILIGEIAKDAANANEFHKLEHLIKAPQIFALSTPIGKWGRSFTFRILSCGVPQVDCANDTVSTLRGI